jgi:hypothetical protein
MIVDFKTVVRNQDVLSAISKETQSTLADLMNEGRNPAVKLNEETINEYLTLLYWTFYIHAVKYQGGDSSRLSQAFNIVKELLDKIRPGFFEREMNYLVRYIQQITAQKQNAAHSTASDPNSEIQALRRQMTPQNRKEFDEQMRGDIENGEPPEVILQTAQYYAGLRESRILRGILSR